MLYFFNYCTVENLLFRLAEGNFKNYNFLNSDIDNLIDSNSPNEFYSNKDNINININKNNDNLLTLKIIEYNSNDSYHDKKQNKNGIFPVNKFHDSKINKKLIGSSSTSLLKSNKRKDDMKIFSIFHYHNNQTINYDTTKFIHESNSINDEKVIFKFLKNSSLKVLNEICILHEKNEKKDKIEKKERNEKEEKPVEENEKKVKNVFFTNIIREVSFLSKKSFYDNFCFYSLQNNFNYFYYYYFYTIENCFYLLLCHIYFTLSIVSYKSNSSFFFSFFFIVFSVFLACHYLHFS